MRAEVVRRDAAEFLLGAVLVSDVRDSLGRVILGRGTLIGDDERVVLDGLSWDALHVVRPDHGDVLEVEAGNQLANAAGGPGVTSGDVAGGHWPLSATTRGIVEVRRDALLDVNRGGELAIYTVSDGQVVERDEVVARVKVIPFVVSGRALEHWLSATSNANGGEMI